MWIRTQAQEEVPGKKKTSGSEAMAEHFMEELGQLQSEGWEEFKYTEMKEKHNSKVWEQHAQNNRNKCGTPRKVQTAPWLEQKTDGGFYEILES